MPERQHQRGGGPERLRERAALERQKLQDIDRLLVRLESQLGRAPGEKLTGPPGAERRTYERRSANFIIRYRWPGRQTPLMGRVVDISQGGLRFTAAREVAPGTALQATLHGADRSGPEAAGEMYLEVVHCRRAEHLWHIGTRFAYLPASRFDSAERRRSRRYPVRLEILYRAAGAEGAGHGRGQVRDISAGGVRFTCQSRLPAGTLAVVAIEGGPAAEGAIGATVNLNAIIKVVRCRQIGHRYEIGAQFVGPRKPPE